ncbi:hypothetical protein [Fuchsiella alkaliacetigena]|uniref:hypothetical protein n=1 Tax=Fuchsiella alkaliacetigena TaxID=957042 RepID=UPI00200B17B6|nr:hypothetical protein [Fuchsiella alkaliacetigena]MCK8825704.1 hypothetical protein [Fuchsiella alkaliacetigena]
MKRKYCAKCDLWYWTPQGKQELEDCPFCSLGEIKEDNLAIRDKRFLKSEELQR